MTQPILIPPKPFKLYKSLSLKISEEAETVNFET